MFPPAQDLLLQLSPAAMDWAQWVGLLLPPPPPDPGAPTAGGIATAWQLEQLLRIKCLLLVAVALTRRASKWRAKLPRELQAAGACGAPCPLFWPPSPDYQLPELGRQQAAAPFRHLDCPNCMPRRSSLLSRTSSLHLCLPD